MKRALIALLIVVAVGVVPLLAFRNFEQVAVTDSAAIGFTASLITQGANHANWASCRARTAQMSYRHDGGTPTASVGTLLEIGDVLFLSKREDVLNFKAIATTATHGQLDCTYGD